jgi:hypothetical protein
MLGQQVPKSAGRSALRVSSISLLAAIACFVAACGSGSEVTARVGTSVASAGGGSASLAWDPPAGAVNLAGYRVYYGTAPGAYIQPLGRGVDAKSATTLTVTGLQGGTNYYFAVTAYDTANIESGFSNEVSKSIP